MYDIYKKYNQALYENVDISSFEYLFVYSAAVIYIAIDRLFKEFASDVERYKKERKEKEEQRIKQKREMQRVKSNRRRGI